MESQTHPDGKNEKKTSRRKPKASAEGTVPAQTEGDTSAKDVQPTVTKTVLSEHPVATDGMARRRHRPDTTGLRIGDLIGNYRLEEFIGEGGAAFIWKAVHTQLHIERAIKVLDPLELEKHPRMGDRFLQEARLASTISHPNLISVHDYGKDETRGFYYLVMDYLPNGSLADRLDREHSLPEGEAIRIVRQVADALNQGRARKMIHRDIKPDNILFGPNGEAKLVDLGIAKADFGDRESPVTLQNEMMGTPPYMAPEQIADSGHVDTRADIYSLGVVFYEMLASQRPYPGRSLNEVIAAIRRHPRPPDLRTLRPEISQSTALLVAEMMNLDPDRRIQTMDRLVTELRALETTITGASTVTTAVHLHLPPKPASAATASVTDGTTVTAQGTGSPGLTLATVFLIGLAIVLGLFFFQQFAKDSGAPAAKGAAKTAEMGPIPPAVTVTDGAAAPAATVTAPPAQTPPATPVLPAVDVPPAQTPPATPVLPAVDAPPEPPVPRDIETDLTLWLGADRVTDATVVVFPEQGEPIRLTRAPYTVTLPEGSAFSIRVERGRQEGLRWQAAEADGLIAAEHVAYRGLEPVPLVTRRVRGFEVVADGKPVAEVRGTLMQYGAPQSFGPCTPAELAAFLRRNAALDGNYAVRFTDADGNALGLFDFGAARPKRGDTTPLLSGVRLDLTEGTLTLYETVEE